LSVAAAGMLALAAGCGSSGDPESVADESGLGDSDSDAAGAQADPDFAGETSHSVDADLEKGPDGDDAVLLAPGVQRRLTELGTADTLPVKVYKDVARGASVPDSDGETPSEVAAADGQQFLVANFESNDPHWEPDSGDVPKTEIGRAA